MSAVYKTIFYFSESEKIFKSWFTAQESESFTTHCRILASLYMYSFRRRWPWQIRKNRAGHALPNSGTGRDPGLQGVYSNTAGRARLVEEHYLKVYRSKQLPSVPTFLYCKSGRYKRLLIQESKKSLMTVYGKHTSRIWSSTKFRLPNIATNVLSLLLP